MRSPPRCLGPMHGYLHKHLLVDLQLCLWYLEVGSGEEAQEELPWDRTLKGHLQVGMASATTLSPSVGDTATNTYPHAPEHGALGQAEDEL